jgi:hypothetical protein
MKSTQLPVHKYTLQQLQGNKSYCRILQSLWQHNYSIIIGNTKCHPVRSFIRMEFGISKICEI